MFIRRISTLIVAASFVLTMILGGCSLAPQVALPAAAVQEEDLPVSRPATTKPPTATPTVTVTPTQTTNDLPTETPTSTITFLPKPLHPVASDTPAPVLEVVGPIPTVYPFTLQIGGMRYLSNFAHPELGCNWVGIGGQVFEDDRPSEEVRVAVVSGLINGEPVERIGLTGQNTTYGPSGYEIVLGDDPLALQGRWTVQLFGLDGVELSPAFILEPGNDCQKNLLMVNFNLQTTVKRIYFPIVADE